MLTQYFVLVPHAVSHEVYAAGGSDVQLDLHAREYGKSAAADGMHWHVLWFTLRTVTC